MYQKAGQALVIQIVNRQVDLQCLGVLDRVQEGSEAVVCQHLAPVLHKGGAACTPTTMHFPSFIIHIFFPWDQVRTVHSTSL